MRSVGVMVRLAPRAPAFWIVMVLEVVDAEVRCWSVYWSVPKA